LTRIKSGLDLPEVDFDRAVQAHIQWRVRARAHLRGQELAVPLEGIDECFLTRWIDSRPDLANRPQCVSLKRAHEALHKIVAKKDSGPATTDLLQDFEIQSRAVMTAIETMRQAIRP
jgi:hypothetical protein